MAKKVSNELNLNKDNEEIIAYGAFNLIQIIWSIFLVILLGCFFNILPEAFIVSATVSLLRKYSGGVHASSPNRCAVIGAVISVLLALLGKNMLLSFSARQIFAIEGILIIIAYIIIYKLAPVDSPAKRIKNAEKRIKFKKKSLLCNSILLFLVVVMNYFYYVYGQAKYLTYGCNIILGVLWQVITLTHVGFIILDKLDNIISFKGGGNNEKDIIE
ncbi:accessory gene regulator ArgB-like protein [Clostridium lundense]|uniref:accessory gene regulator ArgB-like protein n=1 Tax=Clostridium lundense TaxID=319475 RepID=UPI00146F9C0B|nr:accessory gene regulator B family protein [Clostridium lundense]